MSNFANYLRSPSKKLFFDYLKLVGILEYHHLYRGGPVGLR